MRRFNYRAKDRKTGKAVKGIIQADTEKAAGRLLLDQGYIPDQIKEENSGFFEKFSNRITTKDKLVFTRQFATLIGAGLPIATSLKTVAGQTQNKAMKAVIEDLLANVEGGRTFGDACAKYPKVFDNVYLALVRAGEMSGTLDESLKRLAEQQEKDAALMSKIRGAMIYPAIVLSVIILVMVYLMLTIVPQVEQLYKDLDKELPGITTAVVIFSNFIVNYWWLIIIAAIGGVFGIIQFSRTEPGIKFFDTVKLNVPVFKVLFRKIYMARFARTAQILLSTGVAMLDTLSISGEAINNVVLNAQIKIVVEKVKGGKALSVALTDRDYILPLVPQMAGIGEESGKIDEMLGKAAKVYEEEVDEQVRTISTMIEPLLMLMLGGMAALMIGAVLLPIYSLVQNIK